MHGTSHTPREEPSNNSTPPDPEGGDYRLLHRIEGWLEVPMLVLGFVWLVLLILEFTQGLSDWLEWLGTGIWIVFLLDFSLKLYLAPRKLAYLANNWLTVLALIVPAIRVFRIFRVIRMLSAARAIRGLQLVRVVTSLNRGMKSLGASMSRRGFEYVLLLTLFVALGGGAGMYAFEYDQPDGFASYWEAVWWTSMIITSLGSSYWPQSLEGRILCLLVAIYGFCVFGYLTATLATFFIGEKQKPPEEAQPSAGVREELAALRREMAALRDKLSP